MKKLITIMLFIALGVGVMNDGRAQDVSTANLTWTVTSNQDQETQRTSGYSAVFRTTSTSVTWIQRGGQRSTTYTILSRESTWPDVRQQGTLTLVLGQGERRMRMILSRDAGGLTIRLEINKEGSPPFRQRMQVTSVTQTP